MASPQRKKLKVENGLPAVRIPESPAGKSEAQGSRGTGSSSEKESTDLSNGKHAELASPSQANGVVQNGNQNNGQASNVLPEAKVVPNKPVLHKASFPSQQRQHSQQKNTGSLAHVSSNHKGAPTYPQSPYVVHNGGTEGSVEHMRHHLTPYQYQGAPPQTDPRMQGYSPGPNQAPYIPQGYPQSQSPQQYYSAGGFHNIPQHYQRTPGVAPQQFVQSPGQVKQYPAGAVPYQNGQGHSMNPGQNVQYPAYQGNQQYPYAVNPYGSAHATPPPEFSAVSKLSEVFPHLPDIILRKALVQARGNIDDAQALIADDRVNFDHTAALGISQGDPYVRTQSPYGPENSQPLRSLPVSTKRELKAPNMSIREKQALRTAQTYPGQYQPHYANPYNMPQQQQMYLLQQQQRQGQRRTLQNPHMQRRNDHVPLPVYEAPKLRTRAAKKGPKIDIGSDESEDDAAVELESEGPDESDRDSDDIEEDGEFIAPLDFDRVALESRVLHYINTVETAKELADVASCTPDIAQFIIDGRPFTGLDAIRDLDQLPDGKRPSRTRKTVGTKVVDMSIESMEAFEAIDSLVARCEDYGALIKAAIGQWGLDIESADDKDGAMGIVAIDAESAANKEAEISYLKDQPALLPENVKLKDYQLFGVNWLHLMYQKKLSGILADEMGLGKTCQVISFLGVLLAKNMVGPHLIVVPASTLENWLREISRFCPSLKVEVYYGSQRERNEFRDQFEGEGKRDFNIMVTTYQLATGAKEDRVFLKRQAFDVCIYDEGHNLKNSASSRYKYLMALKANFRVLLTGTPLQNNLKELISLLAFVLPNVFAGNMERLDSIYKIKAFGDTDSMESALLSQQRIKRAKTMMTPFILRRYKKDVLSDLPEKKYRIDYVELNEAQKLIYNEQLGMSRKDIQSSESKAGPQEIKSAVNIMMQLRKCSNHPMLFRRLYDDNLLKKLAQNILKEETFKDSNEKMVIEDMEVMSDFELNRLCLRYPKINRFALEPDCWMDACKVQHLQKILPEMKKNGDRVLLFSQFTQTLDILEDCLDTIGLAYFRLDGSTDVSARQDLIDQFHEETDVTVFLLSTKAGGFGINLACANVVIIYDSSFNPHDDKQAEDRAHRVGQKKEVQIIRIVTKNTIEEHIVRLANTKLTLDSTVSGDLDLDSKAIEERGERRVAQTLISQLTSQHVAP